MPGQRSVFCLRIFLPSFLCTLSSQVLDAGGLVGLSYPSNWADSMIGTSLNLFDSSQWEEGHVGVYSELLVMHLEHLPGNHGPKSHAVP